MIDYDAEVEYIEQCMDDDNWREQAYASLASRLREERDRYKAERDNLQHQIDHPVMTDDIDELAKLAWKTERRYLCRYDDDTTWSDLDGWTAYGYFLIAEAVWSAVTRKLAESEV